MLIDAARIRELIPHAGAMCLLRGVTHWDATRIACVASSHHDAANPLRRDGRLAAICGVEYAAQAMALHGALAGPGHDRPKAGYLASLRDVLCHRVWLDEAPGDLSVEAERVLGEGKHVIYEFRVACNDVTLLTGRAAVVLSTA